MDYAFTEMVRGRGPTSNLAPFHVPLILSQNMTKPTVYLETTVIGHLVGRIVADPVVAGRQTTTRNWWPVAKATYRLLSGYRLRTASNLHAG